MCCDTPSRNLNILSPSDELIILLTAEVPEQLRCDIAFSIVPAERYSAVRSSVVSKVSAVGFFWANSAILSARAQLELGNLDTILPSRFGFSRLRLRSRARFILSLRACDSSDRAPISLQASW